MKSKCFFISVMLLFTLSSYANSYVGLDYGLARLNKFLYENEDNTPTRPSNPLFFRLSIKSQIDDDFYIGLSFDKFHSYKYEKGYADRGFVFLVKQKIATSSLFLNIVYDFCSHLRINCCANLGTGIATNKAGNRSLDINKKDCLITEGCPTVHDIGAVVKNFAWNLGGDITYKINKKLTFNLLGYRYYSLGTVSTKLATNSKTSKSSIFHSKLTAHVVSSGMTIRF